MRVPAGSLAPGDRFTIPGWGEKLVYTVMFGTGCRIKICETMRGEQIEMKGLAILAGRGRKRGGLPEDIIVVPVTALVDMVM